MSFDRFAEGVARVTDRRQFIARTAGTLAGAGMMLAAGTWRPSAARASHNCVNRSTYPSCPGIGTMGFCPSQGCNNSKCRKEAGCITYAATYANGCWCSAHRCYGCGGRGGYCGYYRCCDCKCSGRACSCRSFVVTCPRGGSNMRGLEAHSEELVEIPVPPNADVGTLVAAYFGWSDEPTSDGLADDPVYVGPACC